MQHIKIDIVLRICYYMLIIFHIIVTLAQVILLKFETLTVAFVTRVRAVICDRNVRPGDSFTSLIELSYK